MAKLNFSLLSLEMPFALRHDEHFSIETLRETKVGKSKLVTTFSFVNLFLGYHQSLS